MRYTLILLGIIAVLGLYTHAEAQSYSDLVQVERIIDYRSDVIVKSDASLIVTETIKVWCMGGQIRRGIFRDFPTQYKDRNGHNVIVSFKVLEVLRDGKPEHWTIDFLSNGQRVRIGKEDVILKPGRAYTYYIRYKTTRQIGFFPDHDELYWNVTGNGWDFGIDNVSCEVTLPKNISEDELKLKAYTGPQGSTTGAYETYVSSSNNMVFEAGNLEPREGLTIAVGFPKGIVKEPSQLQRIEWFFFDNAVYLVGIFGFLFLLIYYLIMWSLYGRDIPRGTIIPLYEPPENMSPPAVRYIRNMSYDDKAFASTIINMAVKGYLTISKNEKLYTLYRKAPKDTYFKSGLSAEEQIVAQKLLEVVDTLELKNDHHEMISDAMDYERSVLSSKYENKFFITNSRYVGFGILFSVLIVLMMLGIMIFQKALGPFIIVTMIVSIFIVIGINALFSGLMKKQTKVGRKIIDQIEGFRMYLGTAEKERLNLLNPPEQTPELFEKYLPYALALDVEQQWGEQFSDILRAASKDGKEYTPAWYYGSDYTSFRTSSFASSLGSSFSGAISSASSAPGSSSGFSGGSSGGGGGGGGGGGW